MDELARLTAERAKKLLHEGTTTIEVKSGYGLNVDTELKDAEGHQEGKSSITKADLIPTCLAAHIKPRDFIGIRNGSTSG